MRTSESRIGGGRGPRISGLVLVSLCLVGDALATTLRRMDLSEIVAVADRIVHARVVGNRVYWVDGGRILTETTFDVLSDAKGSGPGTLILTQLGGRIDPVELVVDGTPAFTPSEEVVLFTERTPDGTRVLVGLNQGVMRVHVDPETNVRIASGGAIPEEVTFVGGRPQSSAVPLEALLGEVRRLAAADARAKAREEVLP